MRILAFIGSPHKDGNTAWVVNKILEGAKETGAETQALYTSELSITPCKGCRACMNKKGCVIKDDMQKIYLALKSADALVLGTPNYMGQMSAQAKIFVDRLSAVISPRFSPKFNEEYARKKLVIAFTQGNPDADKFKTYYDYLKESFALLEFKVEELVVVAGTRNESASESENLSKKMKAVGQSLASQNHCKI